MFQATAGPDTEGKAINFPLNTPTTTESGDAAAASTTQPEAKPVSPVFGQQLIQLSATSWLDCAGKFAHIIDMISVGKQILEKAGNHTVPNQQLLVLEMLDSIETIKHACDVASNACSELLARIAASSSANIIDDQQQECALVHHDPGLRHNIILDCQRSYLISLGPHQPVLSRFPNDGKNRFNPNWYKAFEFLEYSTEKDAAFCFVCSLFPTGINREKCETAWSQDGVRTWGKMLSSGSGKKGKLQAHFASDQHKAALGDYCNFMLKQGHIDVLLDKQRRNMILEEQRQLAFNTNVIKVLVDVVRTMGRQGLAFRGSDTEEGSNYQQIVRLIARHNPVLKVWLDDIKLRPYHTSYLSPTAQNEFIELLGSEVRRHIISEVRQSQFFCVMADTTPDVSHKDMLSIVVRMVDTNGIPCERLLQVISQSLLNLSETMQITLILLSADILEIGCGCGMSNSMLIKMEVLEHFIARLS